jgi:hypothetical protein
MIISKWYKKIKQNIRSMIMRRKYSDWEDNEYNCGDLKFIWGVKSYDDLSKSAANFNTMNDIEILYNRNTKMYNLSFETIYEFKNGKYDEIRYLRSLLRSLASFMRKNHYSTSEDYNFQCWDNNLFEAKSISELYTKFKVFVDGYEAVYRGKWI